MINHCDNCLRLKEANKLKIPVIDVPCDLAKDELTWCRKCYQDLLKKYIELQQANDYIGYVNACHIGQVVPISYEEYLSIES